jgi:replicative DNA helicase
MKDIELEQTLLGCLLAEQDVLGLLPPDFEPEHFSQDLHQVVFSEMRRIEAIGEKYSPITLRPLFPENEQIQGGYLIRCVAKRLLLNNPSEAAKQLIDLANRRNIVAFCEEAMTVAGNTDSDRMSGEIAGWLINQLETLNTTTRYKISTERQVSERLLTKLQSGKPPEFSKTGIELLDVAMDGGMYQNKLYGIVGRKKMGKTMLSGTISHNLQMSGQRHLYLALEMGSDEIHQRSLARQVECKEGIFRLGSSPRINERIAEYTNTAKNYRLYLDAPSLSFDDLRHILPQYIKKYKLKGFILDCWQLVGGKGKSQSLTEHLDNVAQWLAETVKKYPVWGLVTAQENQEENTRGGEGLRLAVDQLYRLNKNEVQDTYAWLEMMETRYTRWCDVGDKNNPRLGMHDNGTHFVEL